jgi:chemotaxis response regulator CheB
MLRVLMVLEDYGELMFLQTVLKKIGFDVDAIQNPRQFQDALLTMNPDVLVMTATGKKVKGLEMSRTVKRVRGLPHIILIRGGQLVREEDLNVDAWLDSPVGAMPLLNAIGDTCGLNKEVLADKFVKLKLQEVGEGEARVLKVNEDPLSEEEMQRAAEPSGNFEALPASSLSSDDRKERYKKFLQAEVPAEVGFAVKKVQEQVKELRKDENAEDLAELERQRKAFVEQLFKK